jgi:hypothetical protein
VASDLIEVPELMSSYYLWVGESGPYFNPVRMLKDLGGGIFRRAEQGGDVCEGVPEKAREIFFAVRELPDDIEVPSVAEVVNGNRDEQVVEWLREIIKDRSVNDVIYSAGKIRDLCIESELAPFVNVLTRPATRQELVDAYTGIRDITTRELQGVEDPGMEHAFRALSVPSQMKNLFDAIRSQGTHDKYFESMRREAKMMVDHRWIDRMYTWVDDHGPYPHASGWMSSLQSAGVGGYTCDSVLPIIAHVFEITPTPPPMDEGALVEIVGWYNQITRTPSYGIERQLLVWITEMGNHRGADEAATLLYYASRLRDMCNQEIHV